MWEKQLDIILLLGTFTFFTSIIPQMSIFNAHLRMASNLSLKFIILTNRKCLIVLKSLSLDVINHLSFQRSINQLSIIGMAKLEFRLSLGFLFALPSRGASHYTLLLPSCVPGAIWSLDHCLVDYVLPHLNFQNNTENTICTGAYML